MIRDAELRGLLAYYAPIEAHITEALQAAYDLGVVSVRNYVQHLPRCPRGDYASEDFYARCDPNSPTCAPCTCGLDALLQKEDLGVGSVTPLIQKIEEEKENAKTLARGDGPGMSAQQDLPRRKPDVLPALTPENQDNPIHALDWHIKEAFLESDEPTLFQLVTDVRYEITDLEAKLGEAWDDAIEQEGRRLQLVRELDAALDRARKAEAEIEYWKGPHDTITADARAQQQEEGE